MRPTPPLRHGSSSARTPVPASARGPLPARAGGWLLLLLYAAVSGSVLTAVVLVSGRLAAYAFGGPTVAGALLQLLAGVGGTVVAGTRADRVLERCRRDWDAVFPPRRGRRRHGWPR